MHRWQVNSPAWLLELICPIDLDCQIYSMVFSVTVLDSIEQCRAELTYSSPAFKSKRGHAIYIMYCHK